MRHRWCIKYLNHLGREEIQLQAIRFPTSYNNHLYVYTYILILPQMPSLPFLCKILNAPLKGARGQ